MRAESAMGVVPTPHPLPRAAGTTSPVRALTRVLRAAGAALLVASASTFMLQQWDAGNDILRFAMLLGHSGVLVLAAFLSGLGLRESRSARTFLAIVLAVAPIQFAVLGGLLYSQFGTDVGPISLPSYARWVAPSRGAAALAAALTFATLGPLCLVSLTALVRAEARRLLALWLALNTLLLVPVRAPDTVAVMTAVTCVALTALWWRSFRQATAFDTLEGRIVQALLLIPAVMLPGRTLLLYSPTPIFFGVCGMGVGAALFMGALMHRSHGVRASVQATGAFLASVGWLITADTLVKDPGLTLSSGIALPLYGLPLAVGLTLASLRAGPQRAAYERVAALAAVSTAGANLALSQQFAACLAGLLVGIVVLGRSVYARQPLLALSGLLVAVCALVLQVDLSIHVEGWMHWGTLMGLGILVILAAAIAERRQGVTDRVDPASRMNPGRALDSVHASHPGSQRASSPPRAKPEACPPST